MRFQYWTTTIIIKIPVNMIALITPTPKKMTCHQKWDQFKRKFHLPTPIIDFQGIKICMYINIYIYIHTWNPNDPPFYWKRPCSGGVTFKNRGHLGSRYI